MKKIPVYNIDGKVIGEESVSAEIIEGPVNKEVIYYYVTSYLANQRQGNASTKTRGEVSGGGKKPWRQKGTGRARFGSSRNPVWRHGGVAFGPKPRSYNQRLQKKVKRSALKEVLRDKIQEERMAIFVSDKLDQPKTKLMASFIKSLGFKAGEKVLLVLDGDAEGRVNLIKSVKNISCVSYDFSNKLNAYCVLNADRIIAENSIFETIRKHLGEQNDK